MGLIKPRDRRKGKRTNTSSQQNRAADVPVRLKNRPPSENVCEICSHLKKGTTWNETLFGYVCRDKRCRATAKEQTAKEKKKIREEEHEEQRRLEEEAREYENTCKEEADDLDDE